jgi:hypothetical protein
MHYLSHYFNELPQNDPYFVAGLAIPDLAPHFSKSYNSIIKNYVVADNRELELIHRGILRHYGADKEFHQSKLFNEHMSKALQSFLEEGLSRERLRLSFIAHIAVEMMIDHRIIVEEEGICENYYRILNSADEQVLNKYFDLHGLAYEKQKFLIRFQFFKERRFLFLFKDIANVATALNRTYSMVTGVDFTPAEQSKFVAALNNIDNALRYSWKLILNH